MSSHHHGSRMGSRPGVPVPQAPPPPVLRPGRGSRRSRSRSRSRSPGPPPSHHRSRFQNSSRDRGGRRPSPSSYGGRPAESYRKAEALPISIAPAHSQSSSHQSRQQSISLIPGEGAAPIIRRILNADEVKIPRRAGEGVKPIFERSELKEAMLRRMRANDNDENPSLSAPLVQEPPQQQRVIAIIREPIGIGGIDRYRLPGIKEPRDSGYSSSRHSHLQPISPEALQTSTGGSNSGFRRLSLSPPARERPRRPSLDRGIDRKRDLLDEHRDIRDREREQYLRERTRDQDSRDIRERERPSTGSSRLRSRSPVRILRDRRSRSRSVTPPPMPAEIRRQFMDRDLRNKLSRPLTKPLPSKFDSDHDFRPGSSRGGRGFSRGFNRGGRGFTRGLRSRAREDNRSRGLWEHDMYERDGLDQPGGDSKSKD